MNIPTRTTTTVLLVTTIVFMTLVPAVFVHSSDPAAAPTRSSKVIYSQLSSRVDTSPFNEYLLITTNLTTRMPAEATIFATVTVFIQPFQCCPGAFAIKIGIDDNPTEQIGGGDTSRFTGVRVTLTAFIRANFSPGPHSVTLAVFNGGGTWTIDSGHLTALLIQFD